MLAAAHPHPLKYVTSPNLWYCNQCSTGNLSRKDYRYRCGTCADYDKCHNCFKSNNNCSCCAGFLKLVTYANDGHWFCDECKYTELNAARDRYRCHSCSDYDMCSDCYKHKTLPMPSMAPATVSKPLPPDTFDSPTSEITVKTLTGKSITVCVDLASDTVGDLKNKIQNIEGIPPDQQRLIFAGTVLDDESARLLTYSLAAKAVVHLVLKLRD